MMSRTLTNHRTGRTTPDLLFMNPTLLPPKSKFYGALCSGGFKISRIFQYDGKPWQLRTVTFQNNYYIAPFVINTGGVNSKAPIVSTPLLKKIGALPQGIDRVSFDNRGRVKVPSPLGELADIRDWDHERASSPTLDERYNLIGHGWARFVDDVRIRANDVLGKRLTFDVALDALIEECPEDIIPYIHNPHNRIRVEREIKAMIEAIQDKRTMDALAETWSK